MGTSVGAALTLMSNSSLTDVTPSLAVTLTEIVPAVVGLPEKLPVVASNVSQVGSSAPSAFVDVWVRVSVTSVSLKVLARNV